MESTCRSLHRRKRMLAVCMSLEMQVHLVQVVQVARFCDGIVDVAVQKEYGTRCCRVD
jgi:hypothetical protein